MTKDSGICRFGNSDHAALFIEELLHRLIVFKVFTVVGHVAAGMIAKALALQRRTVAPDIIHCLKNEWRYCDGIALGILGDHGEITGIGVSSRTGLNVFSDHFNTDN